MDLMSNATFLIQEEVQPTSMYRPGLYRVIFDEPRLGTVIAVRMDPDKSSEKRRPGGRRKKELQELKGRRKKPPLPLIGSLIWMDRSELERLAELKLLKMMEIERRTVPKLSSGAEKTYTRRLDVMGTFLDLKQLHESISVHKGLGGLVSEAVTRTKASRSYIYKLWSHLCRWGIDPQSLNPRYEFCGAPGAARPTGAISQLTQRIRAKAGRKTTAQRIAYRYGVHLEPDQPGMSMEWSAAIRAADHRIPSPKPSWKKRCRLIVMSAFCSKAKEEDGKFSFVAPELGTYPNDAQIKRVLTFEKTRLEQILESTTKRHFHANQRGLIARNWQGVAGPGHTWSIDSTVGDIYLRSSVNRAWIVGRPIVYIIVDNWSTAIVGFYVCLSGPSWNTAKVALFNASFDPALVADLWGYTPILSLNPAPTLCYLLMCDRGEYLSKGHRSTAKKLLQVTSYAPPYRGDLKGLVEVLHRIAKDDQFLFIPGAMDYRRKELELRKVDPSTCVFTVREYTQYLYALFSQYNLTADRSNRLDAHMRADGVFPSPAGIWWWGHAVGIGYRKHVPAADLITELLPFGTGRVRRDAIRYAGNDYMSDAIKEAQWTALARNAGGWNIPLHYYPGNMGSIWTPSPIGQGLERLLLSDESRASAEMTLEEWSDNLALAAIQRPGEEHQRMCYAVDSMKRVERLVADAKRKTAEALAVDSGSTPTMREARTMEQCARTQSSPSEPSAKQELRNETQEQYDNLMSEFLNAASVKEAS